ncbi:glycosyltransferase family 4 protein [Granulicatella seriolae]|uniref:Glycosyltransferase family 4 protein n=1 Tax=Granulicatella seriolae TaxID=2967226 RepID=A0ABT1WNG1_9LACT|nr:glycosyltransferase family 4 protein [Granulicatella seriolae]
MRIGIFSDTYFPQVSGVATSIRVLKEELEAQGHTVIIFTTTDPKALLPETNVVRLGSIPLFSFKERRIAFKGVGKAYKIVKEYNLDIIHTQTEFSLGLAGKFLGMMLEIPTVHTYHTMYEKYLHYIAKGKILRPIHVAFISRNFCNQSRGVIAPSQMTKEKLESYGVLREIWVIPTGVPVPEYDQEQVKTLRSQLGYTKDEIVLLSLSRLSKEKNIAAVIAMMPELLAKKPNARLCVVGDGPERSNLEQEVKDLQIDHAVQFVGEIINEMVSPYYQMADLYVNASDSESQGLTYLEAMANRVPVIAKRNDYLMGLMTDKSLGTLFDKESQIAQVIVEYLDDVTQEDVETIQAVRKNLLDEISADTFARRVVGVYEAAIAGYDWELEHDKNLLRRMKLFRLTNQGGEEDEY